jgi:hypothetical protein
MLFSITVTGYLEYAGLISFYGWNNICMMARPAPTAAAADASAIQHKASQLDRSDTFSYTHYFPNLSFSLLVFTALVRLRSFWPYSDQALIMHDPWRGSWGTRSLILEMISMGWM